MKVFITDDMREYKTQQITNMMEREYQDQREDQDYGAHLTHWSGCANPVNIDGEALEVLRNYYDKEAHVWLLSEVYKSPSSSGRVKAIARVFYSLEELEAYEDRLEKRKERGTCLDYTITAILGVHR